MKVIFAGTPQLAVPSLIAIAQSKHRVLGVLTAEDKPKGRGKKLLPSPVKMAAMDLGFPVYQFPRLATEARDAMAKLDGDLLVCFAYGKIFGPKFLALFPQGGINCHPSLLPAYRGPSPIQSALLAGEQESGITIQRLALEMDAGDILLQRRWALDDQVTSAELHQRAATEGAQMLVEAIDGLETGSISPHPQDHRKASYCTLLDKGVGAIDWKSPAQSISNQVRALDPWPGAFTFVGDQRIVVQRVRLDDRPVPSGTIPGTVLEAKPKDGIVVASSDRSITILQLKPQAKGSMDAGSYLNGQPLEPGFVLGEKNV